MMQQFDTKQAKARDRRECVPLQATSAGRIPSPLGSLFADLQASQWVRQLSATSRRLNQRAAPGGLPPQLKSGIEALSGLSMDAVRVHYNSSRPAQLNAHAFAQGTDIHLAAGQEAHLPHEAWHVVQQAKGRVKPTLHASDGTAINDDHSLEREADLMGARALSGTVQRNAAAALPGEEKSALHPAQTVQAAVVQRGQGSSTLQGDETSEFEALYRREFEREPPQGANIPKIIHRFWSGGAMSETTLRNLMAMQEAVGDTDWQQVLWTSGTVNEAVADEELMRQIAELREAGITVKNAEQMAESLSHIEGFPEALRGRIEAAIAGIQSERPDYMAVKFLSDMVRLAATFEEGGVYMDTDIAPGTVDFDTAELFHRDEEGEVPLAGVQVQNTRAFEKARTGEGAGANENLFRNTAAIGTPVFNFFYATRAGTRSNHGALEAMIRDNRSSGMQAADEHFRPGRERPDLWMVPWLLDLGWTTEASDAEEAR